jgi:putative protein kinase ArgK-like GTPase of G3E family
MSFAYLDSVHPLLTEACKKEGNMSMCDHIDDTLKLISSTATYLKKPSVQNYDEMHQIIAKNFEHTFAAGTALSSIANSENWNYKQFKGVYKNMVDTMYDKYFN